MWPVCWSFTTSAAVVDTDGDGIPDASDTCPLVADPAQADTDTDGTGDLCDACEGPGNGLERFGSPRTIDRDVHLAVALADFDRDLDLDLAATTLLGELRIYENQGGTYAAPVRVLTAGGFVFAEDVDADGWPDLVYGDGTELSWFQNDRGTLLPPRPFGTLDSVDLIELADLDQDRDLDVVAIDLASDDLLWYENLGGRLGPGQVVARTLPALDLAVGDVDGDGDEDLLVSAWTTSLFENLGAGAFAPSAQVSPCGGELALGDVDADGALDLACAGSGRVSVSTNGGRGVFVERWSVSVDAEEVWLADADEDADADLLYSTESRRGALDYLESVGGSLVHRNQWDAAWAPVVAVGDLDGDGATDLVLAEDRLSAVPALPCADVDQDGDGLPDVKEWLIHGTDATLADTDGDGLDDAGEVRAGTDPFLPDTDGDGVDDPRDDCPLDPLDDHDGDGWCADRDTCPDDAQQDLTDSDFDGSGDVCDVCEGDDRTGDSDADLRCDATDSCPMIADPTHADRDQDGVDDVCDTCEGLGDSDGDGLLLFGAPNGELVAGCVSGLEDCLYDWDGPMADADLDGDGDVDLLLAMGWLWTFENRPGEDQMRRWDALDDAEELAAADLEGDGDPDVVTVSGASVELVLNDGQGNLRSGGSVPFPGARLVRAEDLDGDGDPDVLAASPQERQVAWIENLGGGQLGPPALVDSGLAVTGMDVADLDGDGDPDVVLAAAGQDVVAWVERTAGGFAPRVTVTQDLEGPEEVDAADDDGDGLVDLLVAHPDGIASLRGTGPGTFDAPRPLFTGPVDRIAFADLEGDGDRDVVWNGEQGFMESMVQRVGAFAPPVRFESRGVSVHLADHDGNGYRDLVTSYYPSLYTSNHFGDCVARDTDGDGLPDGEELHLYGSNPRKVDTDEDGLSDDAEVVVHGTSPILEDTDGGGAGDGDEVAGGTDPLDPSDDPAPADSADTGLGGHSASPEDTGTPGPDPTTDGGSPDAEAPSSRGCGCDGTGGRAPVGPIVLAVGLVARRRIRARAT